MDLNDYIDNRTLSNCMKWLAPTFHQLMTSTVKKVQQVLYQYNYMDFTLTPQAVQWVHNFLALNRLEGYKKKCVTPYMHSLVYHVPAIVQEHGNLICFSGQGKLF